MMPCPLDPTVQVVFVDPTELGTTRLDRTHAFALFGEDISSPMIVVDQRLLDEDWFTQDHLMVILAHEMGHIRCRTMDEQLADLVGMELLRAEGFDSAYSLHREEYDSRLAAGHYAQAA